MLHFDRVKETTTTTGTGDITLAGAVSNFVTFTSVYATNDVIPYAIEDVANSAWEVGNGHLSSSTVLVRDTVLASSNAGALVNFSAGTKNVFATITGIAATRMLTRGKINAMALGQALP